MLPEDPTVTYFKDGIQKSGERMDSRFRGNDLKDPLILTFSPRGEGISYIGVWIVPTDEPALMSEANQQAELRDNVRQIHGTGHCPAAGGEC